MSQHPSPRHPPPAPAPARGHPEEPCRNCGDPTPGPWCPACGQRKVDTRVSLPELVRDLLEDQFGVERRTPNTLVALLFRPGLLTREYLDGRVVRYLRPFKLYLVSSVILFLLVGISSARGIDSLAAGAAAGATAGSTASAESSANPESVHAVVPGDDASDAAAAADTAAAPDRDWRAPGWHDGIEVNLGNARLDALVQARLDRLGRMPVPDALGELLRAFVGYIPTLLFVLLPVFAGLLKLVYVRHPVYYAEHFIFVLHTHAFLFGAFSLAIVAGWLGVGFLAGALVLWAAIYVFLALRRVYGQGRRKTAIKYGLLVWGYGGILAVSLPPLVLVTLLLGG